MARQCAQTTRRCAGMERGKLAPSFAQSTAVCGGRRCNSSLVFSPLLMMATTLAPSTTRLRVATSSWKHLAFLSSSCDTAVPILLSSREADTGHRRETRAASSSSANPTQCHSDA
eukprot:3788606-Prymnesium_polylepis.1